jgi:carbon-monoxide dehydrogenase medium subunit/6-hydroxypseudooxynicotine dehydrogenase subunit alpha
VKPAIFEYDAPTTVEEALGLLSQHGEDAKVLAGGQSLVPLMNFRLARPDRIVDLNEISELAYIREEGDTLRIGAMTRQVAVERSGAAARWPLLEQGLHWVGHVQIRNRGTIGGSIAHADPAAELPVALAALDGRVHVRSAAGGRTIGWEELFVTHLTTSLAPDELLCEIELPALPPRTGSAFVEFARRHGDFALGGAAAVVSLGTDGSVAHVRLALLGAAPTPQRATAAESLLVGRPLDMEAAREAQARVETDISPTGDIHGSGEYRRCLIAAMARRALLEAADRAKEAS